MIFERDEQLKNFKNRCTFPSLLQSLKPGNNTQMASMFIISVARSPLSECGNIKETPKAKQITKKKQVSPEVDPVPKASIQEDIEAPLLEYLQSDYRSDFSLSRAEDENLILATFNDLISGKLEEHTI